MYVYQAHNNINYQDYNICLSVRLSVMELTGNDFDLEISDAVSLHGCQAIEARTSLQSLSVPVMALATGTNTSLIDRQ